MTKKVLLAIALTFAFTVGLSSICLAKESNTTTTLSDEVTSSMNKTEKSMDDLSNNINLDAAGQTIENGAKAVGDAVSNGMNDLMNENENSRTDNRSVAGTTGNFTAGQTTGTTDTNNGITGSTWIWIIMVVAALVIVASVWLYASQRD